MVQSVIALQRLIISSAGHWPRVCGSLWWRWTRRVDKSRSSWRRAKIINSVDKTNLVSCYFHNNAHSQDLLSGNNPSFPTSSPGSSPLSSTYQGKRTYHGFKNFICKRQKKETKTVIYFSLLHHPQACILSSV